MRSRTWVVSSVVVAVWTIGWLAPVGSAAQEVGPARGSLVIVGGAMQDPAIVERFVDLAGGPEAAIVVIPTAGGGETYDQYYPGLRAFRAAGATDLWVLHTTDREVADDPAFSAPLRRARGVWFPGGRQWRLADAYLGTRVQEEIAGVLERGGVVGGSSAGATILGSYLARGDTATNTIMMGDHEEGFGFLRDTAIDQHLLRRNRQFDLIEVIETHPHLLGIGIDEDTAIVVEGDEFEVMGQSYVVIYDHERLLDSGGGSTSWGPGTGTTSGAGRPTACSGCRARSTGWSSRPGRPADGATSPPRPRRAGGSCRALPAGAGWCRTRGRDMGYTI